MLGEGWNGAGSDVRRVPSWNGALFNAGRLRLSWFIIALAYYIYDMSPSDTQNDPRTMLTHPLHVGCMCMLAARRAKKM